MVYCFCEIETFSPKNQPLDYLASHKKKITVLCSHLHNCGKFSYNIYLFVYNLENKNSVHVCKKFLGEQKSKRFEGTIPSQ